MSEPEFPPLTGKEKDGVICFVAGWVLVQLGVCKVSQYFDKKDKNERIRNQKTF